MQSNSLKEEDENYFDFIGGEVCLDFVNTGGLRAGQTCDQLTGYVDLVCWSQQAGLVAASDAEMLMHKAEHDIKEATAVLSRAYALREALYHMSIALISNSQPAEVDIEILNSELRSGTTGGSVILTADGFEWKWEKKSDALDQMLAPLARSAATLLTSAERKHMRQCANARCGLLFVDTTKNHRRQWCMPTCGNVVRVRKHRQRLRDEKVSGGSE
jgi:predicted RNA-binding Zn ribbon-like protein